MGSNVQSHQCEMSKDAFTKADEQKKEMELFIPLPWAIKPVICISIIMKNMKMEKMAPISHLYHILIMQNLGLFVTEGCISIKGI